jgi:hypothetical protein
MDENLKLVLTLAAGAAGGAIIAGLFAVVGAWIADKREHKQWLRDTRLKAFESYLAKTQPWSHETWKSSDIDFSAEAISASLHFRLVAPKAVLDACWDVEQQITDFRALRKRAPSEELLVDHILRMNKKLEALGKAMRKSLKLPREDAAHWRGLLHDSLPDEVKDFI